MWVAFVAARAERTQVGLSRTGHETECTSRYGMLASRTGARTCEQVRQMLVGFIFGDEMQTGVEAWAAKAIPGHVGKS